MNRNVAQPLTLSQIALQAGTTPFQLCRLFSTKVNTPPLKYFVNRRIAYARSLLLETSMSIKEIAAHLNYDSPANFATQFRKQTGMSPRLFRREVGGRPTGGNRIRPATPGRSSIGGADMRQ